MSRAWFSCRLERTTDALPADSITGNHFFSVSCVLGRHARAGPDTEWPNHIFLSRDSPLIPALNFPEGFDIDKTPLVSFQRLDVLYDLPELVDFHKTLYGTPTNFTLFDENVPVYSLSPSYFMPMFTAPRTNYGSLIVSTAGHWSTLLFHGYYDARTPDTGYGVDGILEFYRHVVKRWVWEIQESLYEDQRRGTRGKFRPRQVVMRSYNPGHEHCHDYTEPWTVVQPYKENLYNWPWIKDFNKITKVSLGRSSSWVRRWHNSPSAGRRYVGCTAIPQHSLRGNR